MKNYRKGFTILELLVVVAIVGLISSLLLVNIQNYRERSRDAKRVEDMKTIQNALELYHTSHLFFPICGSAEIEIGGVSDDCLSATLVADGAARAVPTDPLGASTGTCGDPASFVYCYFSDAGTTYELRYNLEGDAIEGGPGWQIPIVP